MTVHFVDEEWNLRHFLLDLHHFPGQHTATRIQQIIMQVLEKTKITKKLLGITMDNAASMIAAARELKEKLGNTEFIHQRCSAHILNIAVQHGLQLATSTIMKVRVFVVKIRQSTKLCDSLRTICKLESIAEIKPDLDVETRWNSTYLMLKKFHHMRSILDILVAKNRDLTSIYLQENDWTQINNMIQLLEPIFIATEVLSSSTYPTISDVRLTIIGLLRHLESFIQDHVDLEECMIANSINFKLKEYWNYIEDSTTIGTLLDPCSKTKTFVDINQRDKAILTLQKLMTFYKNDILLNQNTTITPVNLQLRDNKRFFLNHFLWSKLLKKYLLKMKLLDILQHQLTLIQIR